MSNLYMFFRSAVITFLLFAGNPINAKNLANETAVKPEGVYEIPRIEAIATIDGIAQEDAWTKSKVIDLIYETRPRENIEAYQSTKVYLYEDGKTLYILFDAKDLKPQQIRARYVERDKITNDDFVGVALDTFNDKKRAYAFFSNPLGIQMDAIDDDVSGEFDVSWNALWDSAGRITEDGYIVEMAIPLKQLRYRDLDTQIFGINLFRMMPRSEQHRFSNSKDDRNSSCYVCQFPSMTGFSNLESNYNVELIPYIVSSKSVAKSNFQNWEDEGNDSEGGVDLRWGITPDTTLNVTLNPDFSQVEADSTQLDINTKFSLFFPEKRAFFLDNADYFTTPINIIHTRNIADPDFGTKLTGKYGRHTYSVMLAEDNSTSFLIPSRQSSLIATLTRSPIDLTDVKSNVAVMRYRGDIGLNSTLGTIYTSREGDDYSNKVLGLDLHWRITNSDTITAQAISSSSHYPDSIRQEFSQKANLSGFAYIFDYKHDSRNWWLGSSINSYNEFFRADLGFVDRTDYNKAHLNSGYKWHGADSNNWERIDLEGSWIASEDSQGNTLERMLESKLTIKGPMLSKFSVGGFVREILNENIFYDESMLSASLEIQLASYYWFNIESNFGKKIDIVNNRLGDHKEVGPAMRWNVTDHFEAKLTASYQTLDVIGGELFEAKVSDLQLVYQFSIRSSLRVLLQNTDIRRNLNLYELPLLFDRHEHTLETQILYSYKVNPQTLIYAGFSDVALDDDSVDSLVKTSKNIFVKFSYAWRP